MKELKKWLTTTGICGLITAMLFTSALAVPEPGVADDTAKTNEGVTLSSIEEPTSNDLGVEPTANETELKKVAYTSYTFGNDTESDVSVGGMQFKPLDQTLEPTPEAEKANTKWDYWASSWNSDTLPYRISQNNVPCMMTTWFYRPKRISNPDCKGFLTFRPGELFTMNDRNLTFEVTYLDKGFLPFNLEYINGVSSGKATIGTRTITRNNTGEWKTISIDVTDAFFFAPEDILANTGFISNFGYIRIGAAGTKTNDSADTCVYISKLAVYTIGGMELIQAADAVTLPATPIENDFSLPASVNDCAITWESEDESLISIENGIACIHPDTTSHEVTLTATLIKNGIYTVKDCTVTLAPVTVRALSVGEVVYSQINGNQRVTVTLQNANLVQGTAWLILTATDNDGKILKIGFDSEPLGSTPSITLETSVPILTNAKYTHYIWNNSRESLRNSPPAAVPNLASVSKPNEVDLTWDRPSDDYDAISEYAVYQDGIEIARTPEQKFAARDLAYHTAYSFSVVAYDHEGLTSAPTIINAEPMTPAHINLANPLNSAYNMSFSVQNDIDGSDYYSIEAEYDGIVGRQNVNRKEINGKGVSYLYFKVNPDFIKPNQSKITIEVTYYDLNTGNLYMNYVTSATTTKGTAVVALTNTHQWKTAKIELDDASFCQPSILNGNDFRLSGNGGSCNSEVCISNVIVYPTID